MQSDSICRALCHRDIPCGGGPCEIHNGAEELIDAERTACADMAESYSPSLAKRIRARGQDAEKPA